MSDTTYSLIAEIAEASTIESVYQIIHKFCQQHEFDSYIYGACYPTSLVEPEFYIITTYPTEWRDRYNDKKYISIDPTVGHCITNITPLIWDHIEPVRKESPVIDCFMSEAADFGLRHGISFPMHCSHNGTAMLSFATKSKNVGSGAHIMRFMAEGRLFSDYVHEAVLRIVARQKAETTPSVSLTRREKECLLWTAEGKTSLQSSEIMGITERTVIYHLINASRKLKVQNRQQAVARAVALGYIQPQFY